MLTMEVEDWVVLVLEVHMMDVKVSMVVLCVSVMVVVCVCV